MRFLIQVGVALVGWLLLVSALKVFMPYDSTDDIATATRSGMRLYVDHETGCQYVGILLGGMSPRMGPDGKQVCGKESK